MGDKIKVNAIQCSNCKDIIYSRTRHDFHYCSCGNAFVDGGFDYMRVGSKAEGTFKYVSKIIPCNKEKLFKDWDTGKDKYGKIKTK